MLARSVSGLGSQQEPGGLAYALLTSHVFTWCCIGGLCFSLVSRDIWVLLNAPDDPWNVIMDALVVLVAAVFMVELLACVKVRGFEYCRRFIFWVELASIVSVLVELSLIVESFANRPMAFMNRDSALKSYSYRVAKALLSPTFNMIRYFKILKVLGYLSISEGSDERLLDEYDASHYGLTHLKSRQLMRSMWIKVPVVLIAAAAIPPFFTADRYIHWGSSMGVWLEKLNAEYVEAVTEVLAATPTENPSENTSQRFQKALEGIVEYYNVRGIGPYEVENFDQDIKDENGNLMGRVLGELKGRWRKPVREAYMFHHRGCAESRAIHYDISSVARVQAFEHLVITIVVLLAVCAVAKWVCMAYDSMVYMEKLANIANASMTYDRMLQDEGMPAEAQGYLQMMRARQTRWRAAGAAENTSFVESEGAKRPSEISTPRRDFHREKQAIGTWAFDIVNCTEEYRAMVVEYLICDSKIGSSGRKRPDVQTFRAFNAQVKHGYRGNPYHNYIHACDVTHTVYRLMCETMGGRWLNAVEQYALLVSALCHDIGHPGRSNNFLVEAQDELAILYNDQSPLENMHCAQLFSICSIAETNIFKALSKDQEYKVARKVCIAAILHTDMVHHFDMVKHLVQLYEMQVAVCDAQALEDQNLKPEFEAEIFRKDQQFWIELLLHLADVSNATKPFALCKAWAQWCLEEMFQQGDEELRLGLPVGILNDRREVSIPGSQHGFINFVVAPLVLGATRVFHPLLPLAQQCLYNLEEWRVLWLADGANDTQEINNRGEQIIKLRDDIDRIAFRAMPASAARSGRRVSLLAPGWQSAGRRASQHARQRASVPRRSV